MMPTGLLLMGVYQNDTTQATNKTPPVSAGLFDRIPFFSCFFIALRVQDWRFGLDQRTRNCSFFPEFCLKDYRGGWASWPQMCPSTGWMAQAPGCSLPPFPSHLATSYKNGTSHTQPPLDYCISLCHIMTVTDASFLWGEKACENGWTVWLECETFPRQRVRLLMMILMITRPNKDCQTILPGRQRRQGLFLR